jgi:histidinol dehydrogenase
MRIVSGQTAAAEVERLSRRESELNALEAPVRRIVNGVRTKGETALRRYAQRWDGLLPKQPIRVSDDEMGAGWDSLPPDLRAALRDAAQNIRKFCVWQKPRSWSRNHKGIQLRQVAQPLDSVGCYVPGGRYPLVSTVLMTVIPAQVAGVRNIRIVSPKPSKEVLGAAAMLGVKEFYRVGGAQAVAALAYGTESIPRVDKIVGPGNAYVTVAKRLVAFACAIDFLAGPTEALILSDDGQPDFIASDLVAQAEHDEEALSIFITTSHELARAVQKSVSQLSIGNETASKSLAKHGMILLASSREQVFDWANRLAPEHLTIEAEGDLPFIQNAGSVFVGNYSAQAAGDYASGPNHVLPTSGQARFRGGLSVLDFVKIITVQQVSESGLRRIGSTVRRLADSEGLPGHANSIAVRCGHA